jgi:hypothetical protein
MKTLLAASLALFVLPSCFIEADDDHPPIVVGTGYAVVDWTIAGVKDPDACFDFGADVLSVQVSTASGAFLGDYEQDCEVFETSIELEPGRYIADATLLDSAGFASTTTIPLDPFRIYGGDELVLPIDFPPDSFY